MPCTYGVLVCGESTSNTLDYNEVISGLSKRIEKFTGCIMEYDWSCSKTSIDIPCYGRNILESSLTALLGRIDPLRLIFVYKVQMDSSYDLGKRALSAVEWTGDILSKQKPKENLWDFERKKEDFDRALLGNYMGEIVWQPAFRALSDFVADKEYESDWLAEILSESEKANFEKSKSIASRLFSSLSKGVHAECLTDVDTILDSVTLKSLIKDVYKLCATLGLVSHFIDFMATKVDKESALSYFFEVEEMIGNV